MTAEVLAQALGGRRAGATWLARCPAHEDRQPSLSIADGRSGRLLVCCHAGCEQARVISVLRSQGLWSSRSDSRSQRIDQQQSAANNRGRDLDERRRSEAALSIWRSAVSVKGSLVETYLMSRNLSLPPAATLRFVEDLKHPLAGSWPAMVALVTDGADDRPQAIHRTYLAKDGLGKAPVEPKKMMLGPCHGGAVRLGRTGTPLMVGEGIETCLAAMLATGHPAWAALSTSGLRALKLPCDVRDVIVLADGDDPGESAARNCAGRWAREGRRVRIARPPHGSDFNDLLISQALHMQDGGR